MLKPTAYAAGTTGDQLSGWKVEGMSLLPYQMPYCQVFFTGTLSAAGDPAPLVPADLRSPGINQVSVCISRHALCTLQTTSCVGILAPITAMIDSNHQCAAK